MITAITLERLRKRGYISLLEIYTILNPSIREPLSMQLIKWVDNPFLKVGNEIREGFSGVRGELRQLTEPSTRLNTFQLFHIKMNNISK